MVAHLGLILWTKLGSMRRATRTAFDTRASTSGSFVRLEYQTDFENGAGTISRGLAKLLGYNVTSRTLQR